MKKQHISLGLVITALGIGFIANSIFPSIQEKTIQMVHTLMRFPTPKPNFTEVLSTLTKEESSTMSGDFFTEFQQLMATRSSQIQPTSTISTRSGSVQMIVSPIPPTPTVNK